MKRTESDLYSFLDDDEKKSVAYPPKPAVTTTPTPAPAVTAPAPAVKDEVPAALQRKTADYTPQTPWTPKEQRVEAPVVEKEKPSLDIPPVSDYDNFSELVKQYTSAPMTEEEQKRRERGAAAAQSVGALGNVLSALSNLAFTGGAAPSQKLPDLPDANKDVQAFRTQVEKSRQAYLNNLLQGRALQQKGEELGLKRADLVRKVNAEDKRWEIQDMLTDAKIKRMQAATAKDDATRKKLEQEADNLVALAQKKLQLMDSQIGLNNQRASHVGSSDSGKEIVQLHDPATHGLRTLKVTGNKAADILMGQEIDESNKTVTKSVDAFGGKSSKTTERGKSAKQKSGEHTRALREKEEAKKKAKTEKRPNNIMPHTRALGL